MNGSTKVIRKWGYYQVLDIYQISQDPNISALTKRIHMNPHSRFSYQLHNNRDELWTLISGYGILVLEDELLMMLPDHQVQIPRRTKHTFITFDTPVVIIETQVGQPDEEDIERFPDFEIPRTSEYQGLIGGIRNLEETQKETGPEEGESKKQTRIVDHDTQMRLLWEPSTPTFFRDGVNFPFP